MLKNIPNILTIIRFILIPFIVYFILVGEYISAFITLTISGITDILDGFIARRFNFIHVAIVAVAWYTLIAGVYYVLYTYAGTTSWILDACDVMTKYFSFCIYAPLAVGDGFMGFLSGRVDFIADHRELLTSVCFFVIPVVIWLVSRLISGAVRNRRGF